MIFQMRPRFINLKWHFKVYLVQLCLLSFIFSQQAYATTLFPALPTIGSPNLYQKLYVGENGQNSQNENPGGPGGSIDP
jgi:hypothetical protein